MLRLTPYGQDQFNRSLDVLFTSITAAMDNHSHDAKTATAAVIDDVATAVSAAADQVEDGRTGA